MDNKIKCPKCNKTWSYDSEQAACIDIYDMCIICCVNKEKLDGYHWSIKEVQRRAKEKANKVKRVTPIACDSPDYVTPPES